MALCKFCQTTFGNKQAVRAHLKGCVAYKAHRKSEGSDSLPQTPARESQANDSLTRVKGNQVLPRLKTDRAQQITGPTPGSRLDHGVVDVVLRVNEEVRSLRQDLAESLEIRRFLDSVARTKGWPTYDEWYELTKDVVHLEQATDAIVTQVRVSRDAPWALYKLTLAVRDRWLTWRRDEAYRAWEKVGKVHDRPLNDTLEDFGIQDLDARLSRVLDGLRWLVSHTRAGS